MKQINAPNFLWRQVQKSHICSFADLYYMLKNFRSLLLIWIHFFASIHFKIVIANSNSSIEIIRIITKQRSNLEILFPFEKWCCYIVNIPCWYTTRLDKSQLKDNLMAALKNDADKKFFVYFKKVLGKICRKLSLMLSVSL